MRLQLTFPVPQSSRKGDRVLGTPGKFVQQLHTYKLGEQAQRYQSAVTRTADCLTNLRTCGKKHLLTPTPAQPFLLCLVVNNNKFQFPEAITSGSLHLDSSN